jgi:hypothetical protein
VVVGGTFGPRDKDVQTLQKTQIHKTKTQGVEQGGLWKYKPGEKEHRGQNEETTGIVHRRGIHKGLKKGRDPFDPGMGSKMPIGRNHVASKVHNKGDKGRGEEYQVFSQNN